MSAQSRSKSRYQSQLRGKSKGPSSASIDRRGWGRVSGGGNFKQQKEGDAIDSSFGFDRYTEGKSRLGWLLNYLPTSMPDETGRERSGMDLYFIDRNGENFKSTVLFAPYFYVDVKDQKHIPELLQHLQKRYEGCYLEQCDLEDLDMANHLSGKTHRFLKISFGTVSELTECRSELRSAVEKNCKVNAADVDGEWISGHMKDKNISDPLEYIVDLREYDVPYPVRCSIDLDLRVGAWYIVTPEQGSESCTVEAQKDFLELGEPRILAFDIECEKSPLKFPNAESDRIYMISYMVNKQGFLIVNREIVSEDISDFEYTPLSKYPGPFHIFNVASEEMLLKKFVSHVQELRPHVVVTYNGDFFDWPFLDCRCSLYGISLYRELGIKGSGARLVNGKIEASSDGEYTGRCMVHLDAFCWVKRDSYLPQGNQGLKAVTRCKLGYDPVEVDPEDMLKLAKERPDYMASYSVSDAVATYYLYTTYVHNFIFSLSTIIPMGPEDVLRKGSGTLCEALLMVQAFKGNIVCPNKQVESLESYYNGHLLDSETYIGGHVECLEAGIFRADISNKFSLVPSALQTLIDHIDRDLTFALEVENGVQRSEVSNYDEVKQDIIMSLEMLRDCPVREEMPMIYHLDVGAMYPNIILTNRLQPSSIVSQNDCASCDFNRAENNCKRDMSWSWRGDFSPALFSDYNSVKRQLAHERIGNKFYSELSDKEQISIARSRLKQYSLKAYNKTKITKIEERVNTVCMRENSFYVDTVRAFRDRRYDYKLLTKKWKGKRIAAEKSGDAVAKKAAESKEVLMDSLQVAHKCILNSFYGYVMRKGARWRSMEMAGIVTHTGAALITQARILVEQVGRPLELDTDGIWCILPSSFPQEYKFIKRSGGSVNIDYPCVMLNADVHDRYTNHQYQDLQKSNIKKGLPKYTTHSECSIYFELDGPYKAMVLPASPEEGKLLKKKYVVFNFDNTIAELKGFELKRRGELELVKIFQSQVFDKFLCGSSLQESYDAVGKVGNQWLDILDSRGINVDDDELLELISERKTISKTLDDYEGRKATSLTTAERLSDFLGAEMVKDKGLNCNLIISRLPAGAPVTDRAIPVAIFSAEPGVKTYYLRKWLKDPFLDCDDFRDVVDWDYYKDRLGKSIQKIITIPAGMQRIANPCPRVEHPVWVKRILQEKFSGLKQATIAAMFKSKGGALGLKPVSVLHNTPGTVGSGNYTELNEYVPEGDRSIGDIEDAASLEVRKAPGRATAHLFKSRTAASKTGKIVLGVDNADEEKMDVDEPKVHPVMDIIPQSTTALNEWLLLRKREWKLLRAQSKQSKTDNLYGFGRRYENQEVEISKRPMGIGDLIKNASLAVVHGVWQIVEIQEIDTPGVFAIWAFTRATQLQKLYISVPRIIFVNCLGGEAEKTAKEKLGGRVVGKELPHGRPVQQLYEIHLPEHKYIRNEKTLSQFLCDPDVEGVYETKTPLLFRAISRLGCISSVVHQPHTDLNEGSSPNNPFKIKDLQFLNVSANKYMEPESAVFKNMFLYFCMDSNRKEIGALGLFIIPEPRIALSSGSEAFTAKAYIWISQPRGAVSDKPPLQRIFRRFCPDERCSCKFTSYNVSSPSEAFSSCNEVLAAYVRERKGPTVVVSQGIYDARGWRRRMPLLHEFPLVAMPSNSKDENFPAISWQMRICNIMIQRFLLYPQWLDDRISCARYAHVPVGNLGRDVNMTMGDVFFARQLEHNRHLLWASPGHLPDLGGSEHDLHRVRSVWSDSIDQQVISEPGAYRSICVELEVIGLAVAAIMGSGMLDAQGITAISTVQSSGERNFDTSTSSNDSACARAFNLLKAAVTKWIHDLEVKGDLHAHSLLMGLYRYLCGRGQSLMHDPLLYRVVYLLMSKLFSRLMAEFRRLGSHVIYADFYRIVIATNRYDYDAALEYIEFVMGAIMDRDLFRCLQVNVKKVWEQLLWLDSANWSGISIRNEEVGDADSAVLHRTDDIIDSVEENSLMPIDNTESAEYDSDNSNDQLIRKNEYDFLDEINNSTAVHNDDEFSVSEMAEGQEDTAGPFPTEKYLKTSCIEGSWDIMSYLPSGAATFLRHAIDQFLLVFREQWIMTVESKDEYKCGDMYRKGNTSSIDYQDCLDSVNMYMQSLIRHRLGAQLLQTVDVLLHQNSVSRGSDGGFQSSIGSSHNVALNFVKFITKILALDTALVDEVASLRRTLLTQLNMKEFNSLSEFEDPSSSYVLRDIVCSYCNTCRDIDLLRDPVITGKERLKDASLDTDYIESNVADGEAYGFKSNWQCTCCGNMYNVVEVEHRLIEDVEAMTAAFLLQDFRCSKTLSVNTKLCSSMSDLCASLTMDIPPTKIRDDLNVLLKVAQGHRFEWLEDTILTYLSVKN